MSLMTEHYLESLGANFVKALDIVKAKCADYAKDADPFSNFKRSAGMSGVPVERGILVRLADKFARIENLLDKENAVADESISDTLLDAMNYFNILLVWLQWQEPEGGFDIVPEDPAKGTSWFKRWLQKVSA